MSSYPAVDKCVNDWRSGAKTRDEVVTELLAWPTLEMQCALLAQLPDFVKDVEKSLAFLGGGDWRLGAYKALSMPVQRTKEEQQAFEQGLADARRRMRRLYDYLIGLRDCKQ